MSSFIIAAYSASGREYLLGRIHLPDDGFDALAQDLRSNFTRLDDARRLCSDRVWRSRPSDGHLLSRSESEVFPAVPRSAASYQELLGVIQGTLGDDGFPFYRGALVFDGGEWLHVQPAVPDQKLNSLRLFDVRLPGRQTRSEGY